MYTITYNFEQKGLEPVTLHNIAPHQSLLELALKYEIPIHHNCGGMCACSTCHVYIEQGEMHLEERSKREEHFIARAIRPRSNSRLSCQCLLQEGEGVVRITLPDEMQW